MRMLEFVSDCVLWSSIKVIDGHSGVINSRMLGAFYIYFIDSFQTFFERVRPTVNIIKNENKGQSCW